MGSFDMLCFLFGFAVGSVATVIMVRYKQQKAVKSFKSKIAHMQNVNEVPFVNVEEFENE